jgi:ubiquinone/menaquinone biosynthesis C-methylase UbiE
MPRISLPFLKKDSLLRRKLQAYGLDRRFYESVTRFTHHSPQYVPSSTMTSSWEEIQHQGEPNEEDAQTLRDFYADFLRFYHEYTPRHRTAQAYGHFGYTPMPWRIADIGCGKYFYNLVGRYLNAEYYGWDPEIHGLQCEQDKEHPHGYWIEHGYAENLPCPDEWVDVALLVSVLDHVKSPKLALQEAWRILRFGGVAWITLTYFKDEEHIEKTYASHHIRAFTMQSIRNLVSWRFSKFRVFKGNNPNRLIYVEAFK